MAENHTEPTQQEPFPPSGEPAEGERHKAPGINPPSPSRRISYTLFSRETRTGRFFRALLRGLALVVILVALGALAVFIWLYQPAARQLTEMKTQATQTTQQLDQARQDLTKARQDLQAAQDQSGQDQTRLDAEVARSQILRATNAVTQAQLALLENNKPGAVKSLDTAQGYLQTVQPTLEKNDSKQVATLTALFTLAKNDLDRDLKLAAQDLDRLQAELDRAEANLAK